MPETLLVVLGWLFGTLTPGIADAIRRPKRRASLARALRTDFAELRFKVALVAHRMLARTGTMTEDSLALVLEVIQQYEGTDADEGLKDTFGKLLEVGKPVYVAALNARKGRGSPYPVKYELPFLDAHLQDIELFGPSAQAAILRVRGEFHLFNEQAHQVRTFHDRSFTVSGDNHAANAKNYEDSLTQLVYRAEALIRAINVANAAI